jgi:phosphatidylglycerophosphate synthase
MKNTFAGDKKVGRNIFYTPETALKRWIVPRIPKRIETYHLTMLTAVWSVGVLAFSYLAQWNMQWLWGASAMLVAQYLSDLLDGELGRYRNTGLVKWGYFMDHYLDYAFLCSILIGYSFFIPEQFHLMYFFVLAIIVAFMVQSYLGFAASNAFRISYFGIGPTEMRIVFLLINTAFIFFGTTYIGWTLPSVLILAAIGLQIVVYRTQKELWKADMRQK